MSATAYKFDTSKRLTVSDRERIARLVTLKSDKYRVVTEYFESLKIQAHAFAVHARTVIADILGAGTLDWNALDRQQAERPDSVYLFPAIDSFSVNSLVYDLPRPTLSCSREHSHHAHAAGAVIPAWNAAVNGSFILSKKLIVPAGALCGFRDFAIETMSENRHWSRNLPCFSSQHDPKLKTFIDRTRSEYKELYDMILKHTANFNDLLEGSSKLVLALPSYTTPKRLAEDFPDLIPVLEKLFPTHTGSTAIVTTNTFTEVKSLLGYPPRAGLSLTT